MVVAKDKSSALMFDYNLLGKGYAYTDVRNVLSSLSEEAGKAFIDEYGKFIKQIESDTDKKNIARTILDSSQDVICKGWFLPPNTYGCGSFVVN